MATVTDEDIARLADGVLANDRATLARAITLVESTRPDHRSAAQTLLTRLLPETGRAQRIGITGVPGVGKSTFIDAFGARLLDDGHRVGVVAVDPTSTRTGGSILGDKTRMNRLSTDERAFVRPAPTSGTLGGVARRTRESMLLLEAAGHDVILVETVGVGQSEVTVSEMVDVFVALMLPGAGDELQGIKKGLLEIADVIAVNKADGDRLALARHAATSYRAAIKIVTPHDAVWRPEVLLVSGLEETGLDVLWQTLQRHRDTLAADGHLDAKRADQRRRWFWSQLEDAVMDRLRNRPDLAERLDAVEARVVAGELPAGLAADQMLDAFFG